MAACVDCGLEIGIYGKLGYLDHGFMTTSVNTSLVCQISG